MSYHIISKIKKEVELGNVKETSKENLSLFKYTNQLVYSGEWNEINLQCRGIIFDTSKGSIIARSFPKFFNLNERLSTKIENLKEKVDKGFSVTEKLDGSLILIYYHNGTWNTSTTGAFDSEQAKLARGLILRYDLTKCPQDVILSCELISPRDRELKVINYQDREELVLLAAYHPKWSDAEVHPDRVKMIANWIQMPYVSQWQCLPENLFSIKILDNTEGYVIRFNDGFRIKIKSFKYLKAHRLISMMNTKNVIEFIKSGDVNELMEQLPAYYKDSLDDIYSIVMNEKQKIEQEVNMIWATIPSPGHFKESAEIIKKSGDLSSILFARMRNKNEADFVWKLMEQRLK